MYIMFLIVVQPSPATFEKPPEIAKYFPHFVATEAVSSNGQH